MKPPSTRLHDRHGFNTVCSPPNPPWLELPLFDRKGWMRSDGRKTTIQVEHEVQQALRCALLKYKLHTDQDLFDKAYSYMR